MNTRKFKKGISLTEAVIVCLVTGILTLCIVDMISSSFGAQVAYKKNIRAKHNKNSISERISSKVKEATKPYYSALSLTIPYGSYNYTVSPEKEALAVLIPKFNTDGSIVQPSTDVTTFVGVAFSIIPDSEKDGSYLLVETNTEFDLTVSASDPLVISGTPPSDWTGGKSYLIADNLKPAVFDNLGNDVFDVEGDIVNFAFIPYKGNVYFPSTDGALSVDDGKYITRCQFRNYRI